MAKTTKLLRVAITASVMVGCAGNQSQVSESACTPVEGGLHRGATADGLGGEYDLTLVATKGDRAGERAVGRLALRPHEGDMRTVTDPSGRPVPNTTSPLYGTTDVALDLVGALELGDTESMDPASPGVAVIQRTGDSTSITVRLGSVANRRDITRFDGGFTALYVKAIDGNRFAGDWASGRRGREAEGYFCAVRVP